MLAVAVLALLLVYARPLAQVITVGGEDDRAATLGFYDRERTPEGLPYRWTDTSSTLIFRAAGLAFPANRPVDLELNLAGSRPAGMKAPRVTIEAGGAIVDSRDVTGEVRARVAVGSAIGEAVDARVTIGSETFTPPGDRRTLGVAVLGPARLVEEAGAGLALPPFGAWWRWLATLVCGWGVALALLRRPERAALAGGGLALLLAIVATVDRVRFWQFIHLLLLLLLTLLPIVWRADLARLAARALGAAERRWRLRAPVVTLLGLAPLIAAQALLTSGKQPELALVLGTVGLVIILATLTTTAQAGNSDAGGGNAAGQDTHESGAGHGDGWDAKVRGEYVILAAILLLAVGARFYRLGDIPFGMWRDEARHGLTALEILNDPTYRPVYVPNISLPGLYPTLLAGVFKVFGATISSLRGLTAAGGVGAVAALWLVARQLWGPRVALVAAGLAAVGSWRVSIDRLAFDTGPTTLCTLGAFALFLRGVAQVRAGKRGLWAFAGAGLAGGLAIYGYYPGRFALPVLAGAAIVLLLSERGGFARRVWPGLLLVLAVAALTLVPLGRYAVEQPDNFFKRTEQVFLLSETALEGKTKLEAIEQNIMRHVVMFNWRGEPNARHHAPNWPMLDAVTATVFVVGLALAVIAALRFGFAALFLLGWLVALLAPSIVSIDAPSAVRAQDAAPAAYLLAAVGLVALWGRLRALDAPAMLRRAAPMLAGTALALAVAINLWIYFLRLPGDPRVLAKFQYVGETRAGLAIRAAHAERPTIVAYLPTVFVGNEVLRFAAGDTPLRELPTDANALPPGPLLIVVPRGEEQDFDKQVADARRIATAAGLREVPGERPPGGGALTYVAFVRDEP